jgi:hypothetical protein
MTLLRAVRATAALAAPYRRGLAVVVAVLVVAGWLLARAWPRPVHCPTMTQVQVVTWASEAAAALANPGGAAARASGCLCACEVGSVPHALRPPGTPAAADVNATVALASPGGQALVGPAHTQLLARLLADLASLGVDEALQRRSLLFGGSGERWRRVLDRARAGEAVRVAVIGGSISFGTTVAEDEVYGRHVARWLEAAFPQARVSFVNGAVRAVPSAFFRFCVDAQIGADADVVLWDFAVNDHDQEDSDIRPGAPFADRISPRGTAEDEEVLLRRVLALPSRPAVAMFQFTNFDWRFTNAGDAQTVLATYYDVPSIGVKHVLFNEPALRARVMADAIHLNAHGHRLAAALLVRYLLTLHDGPVPRALPLPATPLTGIAADAGAVGCLSVQGLGTPLQAVGAHLGWAVETVQGKTYWRGTVPHAAVTFALTTTAPATTVYLFALAAEYLDSVVACALDGSAAAVRVSGSRAEGPMRTADWPGVNGGRKFALGTAATPGAHTVTCTLVQGHDFRIIGLLFSP